MEDRPPGNTLRIKGLALGGLTVIALAGVLWFREPTSFSPRPYPLSDELRLDTVAVAPGVYLLGRTFPAAVYLVETSEGLVLIDSGIDPDAKSVKLQLAKLRFDLSNVKAILLTHVHGDHSLGAAHLRELTNAKIYAGRGDADALRAADSRITFFSTYDVPFPIHRTPVDAELDGGEVIAFGETRFTVIATPGHTRGGICFLLERDGLRALFTGDVVQNLSRPGRGLMGTYAASLPPSYGGNAADYLKTLQQLREMPVPNLVLPGHPEMDEVPQNPRLSEAKWKALLDVGIAELQQVIARHETDGADFLDGTPRELLDGVDYLGNLGSSAIYCLNSSDGLVVVDAPGEGDLANLIAERRRQMGRSPQKIGSVLMTSASDQACSALAELIRQTGCRVVVPKQALELFRQRFSDETNWQTEDDLTSVGESPTRAIPITDSHGPALAYLIHCGEKTVLFSGSVPMIVTGATVDELRRGLRAQPEGVLGYAKSLTDLGKFRPDLWLPAIPIHGQNANLYDREWLEILEKNRRVLSR